MSKSKFLPKVLRVFLTITTSIPYGFLSFNANAATTITCAPDGGGGLCTTPTGVAVDSEVVGTTSSNIHMTIAPTSADDLLLSTAANAAKSVNVFAQLTNQGSAKNLTVDFSPRFNKYASGAPTKPAKGSSLFLVADSLATLNVNVSGHVGASGDSFETSCAKKILGSQYGATVKSSYQTRHPGCTLSSTSGLLSGSNCSCSSSDYDDINASGTIGGVSVNSASLSCSSTSYTNVSASSSVDYYKVRQKRKCSKTIAVGKQCGYVTQEFQCAWTAGQAIYATSDDIIINGATIDDSQYIDNKKVSTWDNLYATMNSAYYVPGVGSSLDPLQIWGREFERAGDNMKVYPPNGGGDGVRTPGVTGVSFTNNFKFLKDGTWTDLKAISLSDIYNVGIEVSGSGTVSAVNPFYSKSMLINPTDTSIAQACQYTIGNGTIAANGNKSWFLGWDGQSGIIVSANTSGDPGFSTSDKWIYDRSHDSGLLSRAATGLKSTSVAFNDSFPDSDFDGLVPSALTSSSTAVEDSGHNKLSTPKTYRVSTSDHDSFIFMVPYTSVAPDTNDGTTKVSVSPYWDDSRSCDDYAKYKWGSTANIFTTYKGSVEANYTKKFTRYTYNSCDSDETDEGYSGDWVSDSSTPNSYTARSGSGFSNTDNDVDSVQTCASGSCSGATLNFSTATKTAETTYLDSGEEGSNGGIFVLFAYDVQSTLSGISYANGSNGSNGSVATMPTTSTKYCSSVNDARTSGLGAGIWSTPQITLQQTTFSFTEIKAPITYPTTSFSTRGLTDAVKVFKKLDSPARDRINRLLKNGS